MTPTVPARLAFTAQPTTATIEATISPAVQVEIQDAAGARVAAARDLVTLALATNPGGVTLLGTTAVNAVDGIASFSGLAITKPGRNYALVASSGTLTPATSVAFKVVLGFAALSAGDYHTCGLTTLGAAYCWGRGSNGELGIGTTTVSQVPVPVSGGLSFAALSAGNGGYTCGLTTVGAAYCWGYNAFGQLGNGTTTSSTVPVLVSGGLSFAALGAGQFHTCGVTTGGAAYCWGDNFYGELGIGTTTASTVPVPVSGGLSFVALGVDNTHTCGVTTSRAAYCWGENGAGQLGTGTTTASTVPTLVSGGLTFAMLTAGLYHTCGITTGAVAYCWGDNSHGQLGTGTTTYSPVPVLVSGGSGFAAVSSGSLSNHNCGVTTSGAYCWGDNSYGQLGNGAINPGPNSAPGPVSGGLSLAAVSVGWFHTCGLTTGGAAYCWGYNLYGQLGDGTTTSSTVPVLVSGG